ncbi:hypothetical protein SCLCIDRAFT_27612 [Scleroderma citrinum Foug A]|uniref:Uncharacterized protein n=1 Tax=Scleroderma citrinum Foug A TaxID=1036808 RepID=A0A0C3DST5_9AGAM|nr:hypothetical protein SCLCIDRAFT_27612 [Scleroderma citrinum Foug A]
MAAQMLKYMDTFEEHASIARKDPNFSNAYQHCLDEGQALPPNMKWPLLDEQGIKIVQSRMEAILECQAKAIDDHFKICFATNTLLLLQNTIINCLPSHQACEVDEKLDKLRFEHRRAKFGSQCNVSDVAPRPLLTFERPQFGISDNKTTWEHLQCFPLETVIGQQFHLVEEDIVYHIHSIHASSDGYMFSIQYEGISDPDIISNDELDFMLQHSIVVD